MTEPRPDHRPDMRRGRREDARFTSGRGRYCDDVKVEGALHVAFARVPQASGRLFDLDVSAARETPGVVAVLTAAELAADGIAPFSVPLKLKGVEPDGAGERLWTQTPRPFLVSDRVRHAAEPVAMILAETAHAAADGAEAVGYEVEETPAVLTLDAARAEGAPLLWDDRAGNVAYVWAKGDWAAAGEALAASAHVVRLRSHVSRVAAATMEPRACVAAPSADGRLTLWASIQNAPSMRAALAAILGRPAEEIRVIAPDVGGSFGMKSGPLREEVLCAWAATRLGRPVRWTASRSEALLSDEPGRDMLAEAELGLDAQGRFTALRARLTPNVGAYVSGRSTVAVGNFGGVSGTYRFPVTAGQVVGVFSNATPSAPYRGAGRPEATYLTEMVIDQAARELGLDPVELRRRNLVPPEAMPWDTGFIFSYDSGDFPKVMEQASRLADLAGFPARRAASEAKGLLRGLGVANCIEVAGGPFGIVSPDHSEATIGSDGRIKLAVGVMSAGQGLQTAMTGLAAAQLGVSEDLIDYVQADTDALEVGKGMGGSAAMTTGAPAVREAVARVIERAKELAAEAMEVAPADLEYAQGEVRIAGTDRAMSLAEIARAAEARDLALTARGSFKPSDCTYPNGCHVCEVEIDPETGACAVVAYAGVEDIGHVIYPQMAEGQVQGGVVQALGQVLFEQVAVDADGQVLSASFMDYAMPRAADLPAIGCAFAEGMPTAINPLGAKGVGEAGSVGALSAGMSAVRDALACAGVSDFDMPATPVRVWSALQKASAD